MNLNNMLSTNKSNQIKRGKQKNIISDDLKTVFDLFMKY